MTETPFSPPPSEDAMRAVVIAAARGYFDARRARVDGFVRARFGFRGALRLHRRALGWDLARAPANIALAPVHLGARLGAMGADAAGRRASAAWLRRRRLLLETDVAREVKRAVTAELLELPAEGAQGRDALAEAILAAPEVRAAIEDARRTGGLHATLDDYAGARSAVAEMTAALAALGGGWAAFNKLTPGMLSLGPAVATAFAHHAAVAAFPLGATAGSAWYALFPVAAPPALAVGATAGLIGVGAVAAAFAGVVADPIQLRLGIHRRRLHRLIDALERDFTGDEGPGFEAREHYVARLLDLIDAAAAAARMARV